MTESAPAPTIAVGRLPTSVGPAAILREALDVLGGRGPKGAFGRDGTVAPVDKLQPIMTRFKASGDLTEVAMHAGAVARAFPDYWAATDKPGTADAVKALTNHYFADAAYVAGHASAPEIRDKYTKALEAMRKTPSYASYGSCLHEARAIAPRGPNGWPYDLNGFAYRPHEVNAALRDYKKSKDVAALANHACVLATIFPDRMAATIRVIISEGSPITGQLCADMAAIVIHSPTSEVRTEFTELLAKYVRSEPAGASTTSAHTPAHRPANTPAKN
jgi:hypothetical protein